jgi:hypothetical protein
MNKLWLTLFLPLYAFAFDCKVDGISDSPQKMNCYIQENFHTNVLNLTCRNGTYRIKWNDEVFKVDKAYHEDVERGSSPVLFKTRRLSLKTISYQIFSSAKLTVNGKTYSGLCFKK